MSLLRSITPGHNLRKWAIPRALDQWIEAKAKAQGRHYQEVVCHLLHKAHRHEQGVQLQQKAHERQQA